MDKEKSKELLKTMYLSRYFEEKVDEEFKKGTFKGTTHLSLGQEASHVALVKALEKGDIFIPSHRNHGYVLSSGVNIRKMFSELFGSRDGTTLGLGGSMHMINIPGGSYPPSGVVASGVSVATGIALSMKMDKKKNIAVAIFGDGASSRGVVHESMNFASLKNLPVLFYLENNQYGMSTSTKKGVSVEEIHTRGDGYNIKHSKIDGNDVDEVYSTVKKVREYILKNKRPYFLEVETYRENGHSKSDNCVYRTREEEQEWKEKDPILLYKNKLLESALMTLDEIEQIENDARDEIENAFREAVRMKDRLTGMEKLKTLSIVENRLFRGDVYVDGKDRKTMTMREALNLALDQILSRGDRFLLGEDIAEYGGAFGVTKGLYKKYPDLVIDTPVSEEAITGIAAGATIHGKKAILEIMYSNFLTLSSDILLNYVCNISLLSAGRFFCPLIIRTANGGGTEHGMQHSVSIENMFLSFPSLVIVAPAFPSYAHSLLISSSRECDPVLFLEHKALYETEGSVGEKDYFPIGKARVFGKGRDLLVIGYSYALYLASKVISEKEAEFIDLMTIKPLDEKTIIKEVKRFNRILIVQDSPLSGSVGEEIIHILLPYVKDKKIKLLSSKEYPIVFSEPLEKQVLINEEKILKAKEELLSLI